MSSSINSESQKKRFKYVEPQVKSPALWSRQKKYYFRIQMRNPNSCSSKFTFETQDETKYQTQKLTPVTITTGGQLSGFRSAQFKKILFNPDTERKKN